MSGRVRPFDPLILQLPDIIPGRNEDKIRLFLEALGHVIRDVLLPKFSTNKTWSRDALYQSFLQFFSSRKVKLDETQLRPRSTNDLRRLDLVRIYSKEGTPNFLDEWRGEIARPGRTLVMLYAKIRNVVKELSDRELGAYAVVLAALVGETPCTYLMRLVLQEDWRGLRELVTKVAHETPGLEPDRVISEAMSFPMRDLLTYSLTSVLKGSKYSSMLAVVYGAELGVTRRVRKLVL